MARFPKTLLSILLLAASCSVLEDRDPCPCQLSLVWARQGLYFAPGETSLILSVQGPEHDILRREEHSLAELTGADPFRLSVPKERLLSVSGIIGLTRSLAPDVGEIRIPEGRPADSLWFFTVQADSRCESRSVPVRIRKEYAGIEIRFAEALDRPDETFPYFIRLCGESCGLDLFSGDPLLGTFSCQPPEVSPGVFRSTLPRQRSTDSLFVELWSKESGKADDDGLVDRISLDTYIADTRAFSWQDEDLKDLRVLIDYAQASLQITVQGWEGSSEPYYYCI